MKKWFVLALLAGCSSSGSTEHLDGTPDAAFDGSRDAGDSGAVGPTYHADIRPLVENHCAGCHNPGEIGGFEFDTLDKVRTQSALMYAAMASGSMPPYPASAECNTYRDERRLAEGDLAMFKAWMDADMPEGLSASYVAPQVKRVDLGTPDIAARPYGEYTPTVVGGDEYRCFLLDAEFDQDVYVNAVDVDPGSKAVVHHANLFLVNPTNAQRVQALEDADDQPGYPCFGSPGVNTINLIGSWVPGLGAIELPPQSGVRIRKGSRIVMQTHFNTVYAQSEPVSPTFKMYTLDAPPKQLVRAMPFANLSFEVPAGQSESVHTEVFRNLSDKTWKVLGSAAHLHMLASSVRVDVLRANNGGEACVLDIPSWDFNWQLAYMFPDGQSMEVAPGDAVRLTCVFDNSPQNQPVVDGQPKQPQDVRWGGGTFDEMCLNFLIVAEEFDPATLENGALCESFLSCRDTCDDPFGVGCVFNCGAQELDCGECLLSGAQRCATRYCAAELREALPCLYNCAQGAQSGGDIDACLVEQCPSERDALNACMRPRIEVGSCDADLANCNVSFAN